jgi:hypothetical protein
MFNATLLAARLSCRARSVSRFSICPITGTSPLSISIATP